MLVRVLTTKTTATTWRNMVAIYSSPSQKLERTGTSLLDWLDWKSKHFNWNVTEWKATQQWQPCKRWKIPYKPKILAFQTTFSFPVLSRFCNGLCIADRGAGELWARDWVYSLQNTWPYRGRKFRTHRDYLILIKSSLNYILSWPLSRSGFQLHCRLKVGLHLNFAEKLVFSFSLKSATLTI